MENESSKEITEALRQIHDFDEIKERSNPWECLFPLGVCVKLDSLSSFLKQFRHEPAVAELIKRAEDASHGSLASSKGFGDYYQHILSLIQGDDREALKRGYIYWVSQVGWPVAFTIGTGKIKDSIFYVWNAEGKVEKSFSENGFKDQYLILETPNFGVHHVRRSMLLFSCFLRHRGHDRIGIARCKISGQSVLYSDGFASIEYWYGPFVQDSTAIFHADFKKSFDIAMEPHELKQAIEEKAA